MIRPVYILSLAAAILAAGCHSQKKITENTSSHQAATQNTQLKTKIGTTGKLLTTGSVNVLFTVTNDTDKPQRFCKWETPFEPRLGKYFEITDEQGKEATFKGAMARRMMPPPADAYIEVGPHKSVKTEINLANNYTFHSGNFKIKYIGGGVSGLNAANTMKVTVNRP